MLTAKETADILNISTVRLKQILKNHPEYLYDRENANNGIIKIPPETVRTLLQSRNNIKYPKIKILIGSEKGGTGKTITNIHVATRLAQKYGCRCLVVDMDNEGHSTSFLLPESREISQVKTILEIIKDNEPIQNCIEKTKYENVSLLPARGIMRRADKLVISSNPKTLMQKILRSIENDYDVILFDCPPTYSTLVESCYLTADKIYLTTDPSAFGIEAALMTAEDIEFSCNEFDVKKPEIKVLMTKYNQTRKASRDAWEMLVSTFKGSVLPIAIKESAEVQNSMNEGKTIYEYKTSSEIKANFDELVETIFPVNQQMTSIQ